MQCSVPLPQLYRIHIGTEADCSAHLHHLLVGVQAEVVTDDTGPGPMVTQVHPTDGHLTNCGISWQDEITVNFIATIVGAGESLSKTNNYVDNFLDLI